MNVILGGGPAGMFCAHELKEYGQKSVIIEKEKHVGGLAATHTFGNNRFEVGPHIVYTQDDYILKIIKEYLGDDLIEKKWSVAQYIEGYLFKFPNSALDMLKNLGFLRMSQFLISYLKNRGKAYDKYTEFIYSKVGIKLAEFNVINYTTKMWGVGLDELETEWIKPRLDRLSILDIFKNTLKPKKRTFLYPKFGSGQLYSEMQKNMNVHLLEFPLKIEIQEKKVIKLTTNKQEYNVSQLYSSLGIKELVKLLHPKAPLNIIKACEKLKYRSQVYVVLKLNQKSILDYQWIYFNELKYPFCRIHEPKKFTDLTDPSDESLLVIEYFCFFNDPIWNLSENKIVALSISSLSSLAIINQIAVKDTLVIRKRNAYPMMTLDRQTHLNIIFEYLEQIENLHTMGRHGLHTYDNQDSAGRSAVGVVRESLKN
ncbi:MAG: NAD(P)-binding protein [Saprospiraceae bacterium]